MIKVTFEFPTVDAAIVALGKLSSVAPAAVSPKPVAGPVAGGSATEPQQRQPRADKGKKRGSYKNAGAGEQPPQPQAAAAPATAPNAAAASATPKTGDVTGDGENAVTDAGKAGAPTNPTSTPVDAASEPQKGHATNAAAAPTITALTELLKKPKLAIEDAQAALSAIFEAHGLPRAQETMSRFGVQRLRDMDAAVYADFIKDAIAAVAEKK